tara:strand:- start:1269 stop:2948 length:1680 start_codon:yes stop_codon:yes gene_type:complete
MAKPMNADQLVLKQIVQQRHLASEETYSYETFFEHFSAGEILKDYDLSYEDIAACVTGDGGDGGIDSVFLFLNDVLVMEDSDVDLDVKNAKIELHLIQSKTSPSFGQEAINKFRESFEDLFDLSSEIAEHQDRYDPGLIATASLFRKIYLALADKFPSLEIHFYYASFAKSCDPLVEGKATKLRLKVKEIYGHADVNFQFVNAKNLLEIVRSSPNTTKALIVTEHLSTSEQSYVCLATLSEFYKFISQDGRIHREIFESNVRDYQGNVRVNDAIRETLGRKESEDFWYLNNGVTVLTPRAVQSGKRIDIEEPQIVNGLQTSNEIFRHFNSASTIAVDDRKILVRIISEQDEIARDRIIRATNSQTSIPSSSLRSSDSIHRNIEDYFLAKGYFYDRKKNHYKNAGKPSARIVSIPFLAQSMMSALLQRPDTARARPSSLLNNDTEYKSVFSEKILPPVFLNVIKFMKRIEDLMKEMYPGRDGRKIINNTKYYVLMLAANKFAADSKNMVKSLETINIDGIKESELKKVIRSVEKDYNDLGGTDQISKGPELLKAIKMRIV